MRSLAVRLLGLPVYEEIAQSLEAVKLSFFPKGEPETALLAAFCPPGATVLEIGANYGQYAFAMADLVTRFRAQGHVHAFEPADRTFRMLRRMIAIKGKAGVSAHRLALGARTETLTLHTPIKKTGILAIQAASLRADGAAATVDEPVAVMSLDAFVARENIARVDFVRCDVEGAEFDVLQGAAQTLARDEPPLLIEIHPTWLERFGASAAAVEQFLTQRGYAIFRLSNGRLVPSDCTAWGNAVFLKPRHRAALAAFGVPPA